MSHAFLRRADQAVIASLIAIAIAGAIVWWVRAGGMRGELVDIDTAAPLDYRFLVNVNEAQWPELAQLPDIGPTLAKRIVEARAAGGEFRNVEDLRRVEGIGPRRLEAMRRYLAPLPDDGQVAGEISSQEKEGDADSRG